MDIESLSVTDIGKKVTIVGASGLDATGVITAVAHALDEKNRIHTSFTITTVGGDISFDDQYDVNMYTITRID